MVLEVAQETLLAAAEDAFVVAVDTGGTFTDFVAVWQGEIVQAKVPSTPEDPARALLQGLQILQHTLGVRGVRVLLHGTTVATNALLEGRGAPTWFVTNEGLEDLLVIGRQARPELYALQPTRPQGGVQRQRCVGVGGRTGPRGERLLPLNLDALDALLPQLPMEPQSWAVVLLHSYANPEDELRVGDWLRTHRPQDCVCLSHDVLPTFREVERASTTVANAFVAPKMRHYLQRLEPAARRVEVMGSAGGRLTLDDASRWPVQTVLSGPSGGVVAAQRVAAQHGLPGVLSFDMGGTSTDVAACCGPPPLRHESRVGAFSIHVPMLDVHTVGAGGGSILWLDEAGALHVGPQSAGADPGPAAYGRGDVPTVTDAHVVLGRLPGDAVLGGRLPLDPHRSHAALAALGASAGLSAEAMAALAIEVANASMARALRAVSVERGLDPEPLWLCAFGGAGALHAAELAALLGMRGAVIPARSGVLSALGMLQSRPMRVMGRTVLGLDVATRSALIAALEAGLLDGWEGEAALSAEAECRYAGQSHTLCVPYAADVAALESTFVARHEERFGFTLPGHPVEVVEVRVAVQGPRSLWEDEQRPQGDEGALTLGPRALVREDTTVWIPAGFVARAAPDGALFLEHG